MEAYKIILKENGSVRRAEELARRMKAKAKQKPRIKNPELRIVSEDIDRMQDELERALKADNDEEGKGTQVKLARSRSQTKITIVLKGDIIDTDNQLKKLYSAITGN